MVSKLKQRLASDEGFTLIELLVVIVILGILLAIAVPSYLGFKDRANKSAAQSNVRAAIPSVEAYYADNNTYANVTGPPAATFDAASLKTNYDTGMKVEAINSNAGGTSYCISAVSGNYRAKVVGPGGAITVDTTANIPACVAGA